MALSDIATLADNPAFKTRIKGAMITSAVSIVGEAITDNKQILLDKRHILGVEILNSPDSKLAAFSYAVASNPTVLAAGLSATDGDIEFTVNSVFNDIAGVKNEEI